MIICPNFSNPDVAREFEELKAATSEKAAYAIWSLNNGNAIDKAPNGAQSKLFQDLLQYFNGDRTQAIRAKAKVYNNNFLKWFGDWINDPENASKVVDENGEPLVVYHHTDDQNLNKFSTDFENYFTKDGGTKEAIFFDEEKTGTLNRKYDIPVFLNIRELNEYNETKQQLHDRGTTYREIVNNSAKNNNKTGGVHMKDFDDNKKEHQSIWIAHNPNQIKSATDNNGIFSTESNDIRENRTIRHHVNVLFQQLKDTQSSAKKFNDMYGTNFGYVKGIGYIMNKNPKWHGVPLYSKNDKQIPVRNMITIDNLRNHLIQKFNLNYVELSDEDFNFQINGKDNCVVIGDTVYVRQSVVPTLTQEQLLEEFLHPSVHEFAKVNAKEFQKLVEEAKQDFPGLWKQIQELYKEKPENVQHEELVTQVLSKYLNKEISDNGLNSRKITNYIKDFFDWIFDIFKDLFGDIRITNKDNVRLSGAAIKNVINFEHLAKIFNIDNTYFNDTLDYNEVRENRTQQSITRQIYDLGMQIDNDRMDYINSVVNQYKTNNPEASNEDLSRVYNNARRQFDIDKSDQMLQQKQKVLAQSFGLTLNVDGFYVSDETTQNKLMLEFFINSLQESTFRVYNLENINRTKYQQVGSVQNAQSVANVIYASLYNGDLVTLDKELARDYIRMFWGSDLIQSALDSLHVRNETPKELEDKLVDKITSEPVSNRNQRLIDWFRGIWDQLSQLVKSVFSDHNFSEEQKNDIIKAVEASYMLSEDLEYTNNNNVLYDREDGNYSSSLLLSEKDKQVLSSIKQGIKTRLKSQLSRNVKNQKLIADLKTRLEIIDSKNEDSIDDVYNIIDDFLKKAVLEINKTRNYIDTTLLINGNVDNWNPQEINFIQQDLIGYYKNLLQIVANIFTDNTSSINKMNDYRVQNDENALDLKRVTNELVNNINILQGDYNVHVVKPYVRYVLRKFVNEEQSITDKNTFIYNMERWLEQDMSYGDLAFGEVIIGMASRSKSPIVRIVEKMMSDSEFDTNRQTLKKGHELVRLYNEVRPTGSQISLHNWQKRFMEFDENGIPTGYFIRDINYGQFYKNKDKKEQELRIKYNLTTDEEGNTIFNDSDFTNANSIYNKYYDELDEWLDKNCERRYTLDYYKARRRYLSPKTLQAQNQIQRQIDLLLDKCRMESGFVNLSELTLNEKNQLELLRKQKRNLGSHYVFDERNGILHVEEKTGDSLKMADEISAWNSFISNKVKYKPNWDAFNRAKQELIDKYGENSAEVLQFQKNNTTIRITQQFYDLLHEVVGTAATNPEMERLKRRHSEIINALKERQCAGSHNLNKLGLGLNTDRSGWKELQRIEQRMADIRKELKRNGISGFKPTNDSLTFQDIANNLYVMVSDDGENQESFATYLYNQWKQAAASNSDLNNVFRELFTYTDEQGHMKYLKAFKYLTPLKWTLNVNGREIQCIESLPGSEYSELDESSVFVNRNFIKNGPSLQAKAYDQNGNVLYKNKDFESLTDKEMRFLNKLLETMDEANKMIPKKALNRDYLLPQISGRTMSVLANTIMCKELQTGIKYSFRKFGVKYSETTDDVSTNTDLARRPDGSVVNNIPIRFINKLDNPAVQSTDVLGSVIMYYNMACNYSNKSKNLPTLELIKYAVSPDINNLNKMEDQYTKIENILDQRYYGKETSFGFNSNEKITEQKQRVIQTTKTIRNTAAVALLGVNFTTIEVGYIDAMCQMLCDAVAGKYITLEDMRKAFAQCISHTGKMLKGLGNQVVDDKLVAAMQYNQLSRSNSEIFSSTDKFKLDRFVHDHLLMGGYTITDYMVNSMMLTATYNHYRLILDPKTNKKRFYSKTDAINEFTKLGYTEKQAIKLWKKSKVTLWDAYDCIKGDFVLKDEYKDIVNKQLENRIAGRLRDRTAMYNGIIPQTEKAKIQQNVFGSYLTLMRNFYVNTYWDRFKTGGDYIKEDDEHSIGWASEYKHDDLGMVNLETGEFEGAVFKDFARGMYKIVANTKHFVRNENFEKLTPTQKYAVKRSITELLIVGGFLFLMLWSIAFARKHNYDDDKTPAWTLNLTGDNKGLHFNTRNMDDKFLDWLRWKIALLATRSFTERLTPWTPQVAIELFTSPSVVTSYLEDIGQMWGLVIDLLNQRTDEEIKSGGYKHMTRGTRDILKLFSFTGFDNIVRSWHVDGIKSTFNYYRQLAPTSAFVQSQSDWNKEHGLGKHGGKNKKKNKNSEFEEFF